MRQDPDALERLVALADELLEDAAAVRERWMELSDVVGAPLDPAPAEDLPPDEMMRLVVLDMMLAGRSEEETIEHLRVVFGDAADRGEDLVADVFSARLEPGQPRRRPATRAASASSETRRAIVRPHSTR